MVTLKDIASLTGFNISTVSKALRGSDDINRDTMQKICSVANELGYSYVKSVDSKTIGLVFPELGSQYYNSIQDSFCRRVRDAGYRTITLSSDFSNKYEMDSIEYLIKKEVCGICCLIESIQDMKEIKELVDLSYGKFLLISPDENINFCDSISINHKIGASMAVNHLIELGHKRIAFIGETNTFARQSAFCATMEECNIPIPSRYIVVNEYRFEKCGYVAMKQLLSEKIIPTAIFAAYDNIAFGVMKAIYEAGLRIPEDISVIGIDNIQTSSYLYRSLTSINSPTTDVGEISSTLMLKRIEGKSKAFQNVRLCPTLCKRETTAPPRTSDITLI